MKRLTLFTALAFVIVTGGQAKVKLPSILADQMVLQQQEKVKLWGSSDRKGKLDITTSWNSSIEWMSISMCLNVLNGCSGNRNLDTMGRKGFFATLRRACTASSSV